MREFREMEKVEAESSYLKTKLDKVEDNRTFDEIRNLKISDLLSEFKEKLDAKETYRLEDKDLTNIVSLLSAEKWEELKEKYPNIEQKVKRIDDSLLRLDSLNSEGKVDLEKKIDEEIRRYKGTLLEILIKEDLNDVFDAIEKTQRNIDTPLGETKPDIVARDAQTDFKIGDVSIKAGEDVYIECKMGESSYLSNQFSDKHIYKQLQGHHIDAKENNQDYKSILLVSKDFLDLPKEKQEEYSKRVKELGSEIVVLESSAKDMDDTVNVRFKGGE